MHPSLGLNLITWAICFSLNISFFRVNSDPRVTVAGPLCDTAQATGSSIPTFVRTMERLSYQLNYPRSNFATARFSNTTFTIYALFQYHRDLSHFDCLSCYAVSHPAIPNCLPKTSGRYFLDGCFLRYDNYSFFHDAIDPATDTRNCHTSLSGGVWSYGGLDFPTVVRDLVENLAQLALSNNGFGVMGQKGVFGLAQCWERLSKEECRICLNKAKTEAKGCLPSPEGRSMNAGCFLRYSTHRFFNDDLIADGGNSGNLHGHFYFE